MKKDNIFATEYIMGELWRFPKSIQIKKTKKLQSMSRQYNEALANLEGLYNQTTGEVEDNFRDEVYRAGEKIG